MKMLKIQTIDEVKAKIRENFSISESELVTEEIRIENALGRIIAEDIKSTINVPTFNRSTVDGYAVKSKDTEGASESIPMILDLLDPVEMGQENLIKIEQGTAVYVPTGGMVPTGADSMVMIEYTENFGVSEIGINRSASPRENVVFVGDDVEKGQVVIRKNTRIRPQEIGALAAIGIKEIRAYKKIKVAVISTGDELIKNIDELKDGKVLDINTSTLKATAEKLGCEVVAEYVLKDEFELLKETVQRELERCDVIAISGGSSVGDKDFTADVIDALGEPGVFVHGMAIKPGKPTICGKIQEAALFGLPGHPVSAMVVFQVLLEEYLKVRSQSSMMKSTVQGQLETNVYAAPGRETYQMVKIHNEGGKNYVRPIFGKSGMITLLSEADGYLKIPMDTEGIPKGEIVEVVLF